MKINLKKFKWIQILFLFLIFYGILRNKNESVQYLNKEDKTYSTMKNHLLISEFRSNIDKKLELLLKNENLKNIKIKDNKIKNFLVENNFEYFYIYFSNNIVVYFFKRNNINENQNLRENDKIYFEGLRKIKEISNFSLPKIIKNKGILCIKDKVLEEEGILIKLDENNLIKIEKSMDIINTFLYFKKNIYLKKILSNQEQKYHIEMEGFSLGGLYSQLFLYNLYKNNLIEDCLIDYINIESWFGGDKEKYEEFKKIIKMKNIMTFGSLFYLYNKFFQKYNNINEAVYIDETDEMIFLKYMKQPFPYGIIDYIKNYHIIKDFLPKIE